MVLYNCVNYFFLFTLQATNIQCIMTFDYNKNNILKKNNDVHEKNTFTKYFSKYLYLIHLLKMYWYLY